MSMSMSMSTSMSIAIAMAMAMAMATWHRLATRPMLELGGIINPCSMFLRKLDFADAHSHLGMYSLLQDVCSKLTTSALVVSWTATVTSIPLSDIPSPLSMRMMSEWAIHSRYFGTRSTCDRNFSSALSTACVLLFWAWRAGGCDDDDDDDDGSITNGDDAAAGTADENRDRVCGASEVDNEIETF